MRCRRSMLAIAIAAIGLLVVASAIIRPAGNKLHEVDAERIRVGMSKDEVSAVLGRSPDRLETELEGRRSENSEVSWTYSTVAVWESDNISIRVWMNHDKVYFVKTYPTKKRTRKGVGSLIDF